MKTRRVLVLAPQPRQASIARLCFNRDPDFQGFQFSQAFLPELCSSRADFIKRTAHDRNAMCVVNTIDFDEHLALLSALRCEHRFNNLVLAMVDTSIDTKEEAARMRGALLTAGADDAQSIGLDRREMLFRLRALAERDGEFFDLSRIPVPGGIFNAVEKTVTGPYDTVSLTGQENNVLRLMVMGSPRVFSCRDFIDILYGSDDPVLAPLNRIRVIIFKLREKVIQATKNVLPIVNFCGRGYAYDPASCAERAFRS